MKEHDKQRILTMATERIRVFLGGNRTGKTEWNMHEVSRFAHKEHPTIQFDPDPVEIWVCTETYDVHKDVLQPILKKYLDPTRIVDETFVRKGIWSEIKYRAADGTISKITFKSYDQGRARFQGAAKTLISFDEEPPHDIWEECTVRVGGDRDFVNGVWIEKPNKRLRIIMSMTPVNGMTWVYDEIYLATGNTDLKVIVATWRDNPWLSEETMRQMSSGLTAEALQVRRDGKFTRMTGLVCAWFERDVHVTEFKVDPSWDFYRAIDFGFSDPTCVAWIGVDYEDNWYVYDGIYQPGLTTPMLKDAIIRKDSGRYIVNCWADSAQPSDIQELNDAGVLVSPVDKIPGDSKESWDEYRARILMQQGKVVNGKSKIFISPHLVRIDEKLEREVNWAVNELEKLKWAEKLVEGARTQKPMWGAQKKHFIDVLSYFAHEYRKEHKFQDTPGEAKETPDRYTPVYSDGAAGYDAYDV